MQLMTEANFVSVFIGIESPNEASLRETKKFQNVRKGGSIADKVRIVQEAGLDVWCGMILGFDHDDTTIFVAQKRFLQDAHIAHAMIGILHAIPKTPLYDRLAAENRLDYDDEPSYGTNVIPLQMSRAELTDGFIELMRDVYSPRAYFDRVDDLFLNDRFRFATPRLKYWRNHPCHGLKSQTLNLVRFAGIYWRLMSTVKDRSLRSEYRRRIAGLLRSRRDPAVLFCLRGEMRDALPPPQDGHRDVASGDRSHQHVLRELRVFERLLRARVAYADSIGALICVLKPRVSAK